MVHGLDTLARLNDEASAAAEASAPARVSRAYRLYVGHAVPDGRGTVWTSEEIREAIEAALDRAGLPSATLYSASGIWAGEAEPTTVVEVWTDAGPALARDLARDLARILCQDAVGLVLPDGYAELWAEDVRLS